MTERYTFKEMLSLPTLPGVYTLYGPEEEPLYIGKSRNVRNRVLSDFSEYRRTGRGKRLYSEVASIGVEMMAGDMGTSLLELVRIKEELPIYNRRSRHVKELVYALEGIDKRGYKVTKLKQKEKVSEELSEIIGVFRSHAQAKSILVEYSREYMLCPKLLGLEKCKGECFSVRLDGCKGACVGKENAMAYNLRMDCAFGLERIRQWTYGEPLTFTETSADGLFRDVWTIDRWSLISAYRCVGNSCIPLISTNEKGFDFDMYKVLIKFL